MLSANPLVSIIIPSYNSANTIAETIKSVITQTYKNWELLIVDDSSTDSTSSICNEYSKMDNRILFYKTDKQTGSPSIPRNIGIDHAKGKYIAFLDADDEWLPNKLETQIQFMEEKGAEFVYSDYEKIDINGNRNSRIVKTPKVSTYWDVIETCTIPCLTAVLSKKVIGETRFKQIPKEDLAFWLDILKKNITAYNAGGSLALYREQLSSRSSNKLQMLKGQWNLLRNVEGVKPFIASYFMVKYIYYGLKKYFK